MPRSSERLVACLLHVPRANRLLLVGCIAISGCMPPLLAPEDRSQVCRIAVDEKFELPVFHENPLAKPTGGLTGAAAGALSGLWVGLWPAPLAIITVPLAGIEGAGWGAACATASLSRPDAEVDFENVLKTADAGYLKRALEADLRVSRAACARPQVGVSAAVPPDTIIEIEKVDVVMGCAFGKQEYLLAVTWRVIRASNGKVLGEKVTRCRQESYRDVDDWFADSDQARVEIEGVFAKTGQRMAAELTTWDLPECRFLSSKTGEIMQR